MYIFAIFYFCSYDIHLSPSGKWPELQHIDLSYNRLTFASCSDNTITSTTFISGLIMWCRNLPRIEYLQLEGNPITEFEYGVMGLMDTYTSVFLCICLGNQCFTDNHHWNYSAVTGIALQSNFLLSCFTIFMSVYIFLLTRVVPISAWTVYRWSCFHVVLHYSKSINDVAQLSRS